MTDTISAPTSYTMMMVYQTLQPATPQQLWRLSRTDSIFYAVTTHGFITERTKPSTHTTIPRTTPTIYTLQHTLHTDTAYHGIYQLHTGATAPDSSQIVLYEAAYFNNRLTKRQSLMFQTYLAIKYGITLDKAPYLSTCGDTLWHPKTDRIYYHRLQGIGTDSVYPLNAWYSSSLEDSLLRVFTVNPLSANTYTLVGDDDMPLDWQLYENGNTLLQRTWLLRTTDTLRNISIVLNKPYLPDTPDNIALICLSTNNDIIQTIHPDSINAANQLYYTISHPTARTLFSSQNRQEEIHRRPTKNNRNTQYLPSDKTYAISIFPNPTYGEYTLSISLPQTEDLLLTIQDPSGKILVRHILTGATDYRHCGLLSATGMYIFSLYTQTGELLGTRELLVY